MIFSRAWFALMRRNFIYRRRNWISFLFEILLPMGFVWALVGIKTAVKNTGEGLLSGVVPAYYPSDDKVRIPFTFRDYITTIQADRVCTRFGRDSFRISGIPSRGYNWQVPFVKCDSTKCTAHNQDARPFCEYAAMGVAPSSPDDKGGRDRTIEFTRWLYGKYPELRLTLPFEFIQHFESPRDMDDYVKGNAYERPDVPKLAMGIVWEGGDPFQYSYQLRQNSTNFNAPEAAARPATRTTPTTKQLTNDYARTDFETCRLIENAPILGPNDYTCTGQYFFNGVLTIQRLIGDFILDRTGAAERGYKVAEAGVRFVEFPIQSFEDSGFFASIELMGPLLLTLGMMYPLAVMIGYIVREKELRQKELLKMMSVLESDIGWSWFATFFIGNVASIGAATMMSTNLYELSETRYLFAFWFYTFLAVTVFAMYISSFSSQSSRAVLYGMLYFLMGVFVTIAIPIDYTEDDGTLIGLISTHPVAAFSYGLQEIGRLEDQGIGLTSDSISISDNPSGFTFNDAISYLIFDSILWGIVAWYLNRVIKPDYGQALPMWFPFTVSYWWPSRANAGQKLLVEEEVEEPENSDDVPIEPVSDALKRQSEEGSTIEMRGLRKVFGDKTAVDKLSLTMYNGQITALLGHNGAGKTTTINMLTGALAPTSGYAVVAGKDIRTQLPQIRQDIGICLQHDCLFPLLTVREHVQFFARLKGLYQATSYADAEAQVTQSIQDVALLEKSNTFSKNLSGGMKRKLSVAIAFCGGSKVVLLDEPTSGMDPFSRRFTWNVIRHYRKDRCIILTTHFMDEADILGDRIAIMAEGSLRCFGSSLFLKKTYGVGYQLTIEKSKNYSGTMADQGEDSGRDIDLMAETSELVDEAEDKLTVKHSGDRSGIEMKQSATTDPIRGEGSQATTDNISELEQAFESSVHPSLGDEVKSIVTSAVSSAALLSDVGSEISFQLPIGAASEFLPMFEQLDRMVDKGGIDSYGVSITTLDEVFLLVARGHVANKPISSSSSNSDESNTLTMPRSEQSSRSNIELEKDGLFFRHVAALFRKRAAFFRRDKKAWLCTTVLPSLAVFVGFLIFTVVAPDRNMDPLVLDLGDLNGAEQKGLQNPIPFNHQENVFRCQPGRCSWRSLREPVMTLRITNEKYYYCGGRGKVEKTPRCSLSVTDDVMASMTDYGAVPVAVPASGVSRTSRQIAETAKDFAASQYGAVFFTHDGDSLMDDFYSTPYSEAAKKACLSRSSNYTTSAHCDDFEGIGYVIQYNYTALHAAPLYQTLADEALVREATGSPDFRIRCTIAPMPITKTETKFGKAEDVLSAWFLVVLSFPFIAGAFASFVVTERESKAKHLQTVAGVQPTAYWLSTLLWDILNYQIPMWIMVMLMFAFDVDILTTSERDVFSGVVTALFLYGPASAGFTYCVTFAFSSPSLCNMFIILFGILVGMGGPLTCFILLLLGINPLALRPNLVSAAETTTWVLRAFPSFCFGNAIFKAIYIEVYSFVEGDFELSAWTEPVILYDIILLACQSVGYVGLAILLDMWSTNPRARSIANLVIRIVTFRFVLDLLRSRNQGEMMTIPDDDDVIKEQQRVGCGQANDDLIVVSNLTKIYDTGKLAVNNLSLGIPHGECFGLLGINGAGKTTTLGILTAEFPPTSGDATLASFSVTKEPQRIRRRIGYCPQFDAHFANLTGREHVELYAAVKGVPRKYVHETVAAKLAEVGLSDADCDRLSAGYSGGMKRRLSIACATIGQPQIVFLDECSTGVDPVARREIWQLVSDMVSAKSSNPEERTSVILTTHSMEECEALCSRIGIMANGKLRCLGSAQHLKNKFGKGFQVEMKVAIADSADEDFLEVLSKLERVKGSVDNRNDPDVAMREQPNKAAEGRGEHTRKDGSLFTISEDAADDCESPQSQRGLNESLALSLEEATAALKFLSHGAVISDMLQPEHPYGYPIWKDALAASLSINALALFATNELRVMQLQSFMDEKFPNHVMRERQDTKARYEVNAEGLRISTIFAEIESNKSVLKLADYGVSQTSLEQVFNTHAAEAEKMKQGQNER